MNTGLDQTDQSMGRPTAEWVGQGPDPAPKIPRGGKAFEAPRALHKGVRLDFMIAWFSSKPLEVTLGNMW